MFSRDMVINIFQTAYEPGHTEAVINIVEKLHYDVNSAIPSNGLTLFLVNIFFLFFFFFCICNLMKEIMPGWSYLPYVFGQTGLSKQYGPVSSGSTLFANHPAFFRHNIG